MTDLERMAIELAALRAKGIAGPLTDEIVINGFVYKVTITEASDESEPFVS
jgi:hypothetical protein